MPLIEIIELGPSASQLDRIEHLLRHVIHALRSIHMDLARLQQSVAYENTVIDSAVALLNGLGDQIRNLPHDDPSAANALADLIDSKKNALAAAITANTPAADTSGNTDTGTTGTDTGTNGTDTGSTGGDGSQAA